MTLTNTRTTLTENTLTTVTEKIQPNNSEIDLTLNINPDKKFQTIYGFGGAITDSSGYVYSTMSQENKEKLIKLYYTKEGLNYTLARIHLDSCDFSTHKYCAIKDKDLSSFTLEETQKHIIPLIKDIQSYTGRKLKVIATPWSPPAFLKTNHMRILGGKLKEKYYDFYASYICKYITELKKEDVNVEALTIQNEPSALQPWDSCIFNAEQEGSFIKNYLYPELVKNNLHHIHIYIHDHNKDDILQRADAILQDDTLKKIIKGIAFHWYTGDYFNNLEEVRRKYPDKNLILSEMCVGHSKEDKQIKGQMYAHEYLGDLNNGANALMDWNILLDSKGGPNHVRNFCDSPIRYNKEEDRLEERFSSKYIWHFSHFIEPNSVRIENDWNNKEDIEVGSFLNPDGKIVLIALNRNSDGKTINVKIEKQTFPVNIEPNSINTITCSL